MEKLLRWAILSILLYVTFLVGFNRFEKIKSTKTLIGDGMSLSKLTVDCRFDGPAEKNDFVTASETIAGDCHASKIKPEFYIGVVNQCFRNNACEVQIVKGN